MTGPVEGAAIGNLLTQAMATGDIKDISELWAVVRRFESVERFEPLNTKIWESAYQRLIKLQNWQVQRRGCWKPCVYDRQ